MISTLDLRTAYENVDAVRDFCRKLMAIALMPMDDVEDAYLENQEWISVIGKEMYSVYNLAWLTNNNCECTFEVLSCQEEFCKVLNDAVKTLEDTGSPLEAASYYQKISNKFDVGRDRSKYVLK
ncbi:unnamed protein product [Rotaria sp. Silwood2]|nr:unnamed protein product [Rotaria sp. Silwood2]